MPDDAGLLDLYQQGRLSDALGRAGLLGRAAAGEGADALPLAELDRRIWALHRALVGPVSTEAGCPCPECGARLEFLLPADFAPPGGPAPETVTVAWRGAAHALRLPRLGDFGPAGLDCTRLGAAPWDEPGFAAAAARALHEADPALVLTFAMTCPECGAAFDQLFDPAAYLWAEIDDMSRDLLGQVILLARSFGWSEAAILAMPRARRALYLAGLAEAAP